MRLVEQRLERLPGCGQLAQRREVGLDLRTGVRRVCVQRLTGAGGTGIEGAHQRVGAVLLVLVVHVERGAADGCAEAEGKDQHADAEHGLRQHPTAPERHASATGNLSALRGPLLGPGAALALKGVRLVPRLLFGLFGRLSRGFVLGPFDLWVPSGDELARGRRHQIRAGRGMQPVVSTRRRPVVAALVEDARIRVLRSGCVHLGHLEKR